MARRMIEVAGRQWEVSTSGRITQYLTDEFGLIFTPVDARHQHRVARYSPLGAKSRELSLAQLTDAELRDLLAWSQPSWTAPEMGYRR